VYPVAAASWLRESGSACRFHNKLKTSLNVSRTVGSTLEPDERQEIALERSDVFGQNAITFGEFEYTSQPNMPHRAVVTRQVTYERQREARCIVGSLIRLPHGHDDRLQISTDLTV
jgi:hypothetical protein